MGVLEEMDARISVVPPWRSSASHVLAYPSNKFFLLQLVYVLLFPQLKENSNNSIGLISISTEALTKDQA